MLLVMFMPNGIGGLIDRYIKTQRFIDAREVARDGADYIVVGRPIIAASDPAEAARHILERMAQA